MNTNDTSRRMRIRNKNNPRRLRELVTALVLRGRQWSSQSARSAFNHLLDSAMTQPQVIVRRGKKYLVIESDLLGIYSQPPSASEMVTHFRKLNLPPLGDFPSTKSKFGKDALPDITDSSKLTNKK